MNFEQKADPISADIAVIGLACRFPGGASNESKFWDLLHGSKSAYSEVPADRYNVDAFHHPAEEKLNTLRARGGHFLEENVAAFDAPFFNITANEAKAMDPTARMLLEVTYEALENAGLPVENMVGSDTSCYVGCFTRDYHEMLMRDAETAPMYAGTGTGFSLLSNRVSWFYDFRGPSLTLDTACSSSMVGLHLACQGLRSGESKVAVVSGANLILGPDLALWLSNLHMLSPSGLSKSFSEGAKGYGRGEGIATVILKPLADATRDGDTIRAIIRGTGVNQDGHTTGITLPSSDAQADLIRSTYRSAGLDFSQTPYFEAHGTGTAAGDPLELAAVAKTVSQGRNSGNQLLVGSVKSNIGHLEGAAGLAGVIKCILMLENDTILPNVHFDKPNPRIPFINWNIRVPTSVLPWPPNSIRRISVNSFGYGGTNAHAIIDGADDIQPGGYLQINHKTKSYFANGTSRGSTTDTEKQLLFVFSAHDEATLERMRKEYKHHLEAFLSKPKADPEPEENAYLINLSFTLSERRSRFNWKAYVLASTVEELINAISGSGFKPIRSSARPRIAFVFTGQGAQWARMGLQLMKYDVFRESFQAAESHLKGVVGAEWSIMQELERRDKASNIQFAKFSQPLCTILQVALVDLLKSWNIEPTGVVGHSSGEIAAAYCYGALSREAAWEISYWRGKLCSELGTEMPRLRGAMMAVGLSSQAAQEYIAGVKQGKIVVACVNSPSSITISGDEAGIDELQEKLKIDSVFCRKLKVENAYHSHHMELIAKKYLDKLSSIRTDVSTKEIKMISSVTQKAVNSSDLSGSYWVRNMVSPVLFSTAVKILLQDTTQRRRRLRKGESDYDFILEIGPHAALKGPLRQIVQEVDIRNIIYQSVLMRGEDATKTAMDAAGTLFLQGSAIAISEVSLTQTKSRNLVDLPPYPWNHSLTYWSESRVSKNYRFREHGRHDLLGSPVPDFNELEPRWRHFLRPNENPWIRDHVIHSSIIYPGAGTIALVLEAVHQISDKEKSIQSINFKDVSITKAIVVPDDQFGVECILQMRRQRGGTSGVWSGWWEFSVFSCLEDQKLEENAFGMVTIQYQSEQSGLLTDGSNLVFKALKESYESAKKVCTRSIDPKDFYEATTAAGLKYGPSFQGLTEISAGKDYCCCTIAVPDTREQMPAKAQSPHLIHPTTLDIIFHSMFAALGDGELNLERAAVPVSFDSIIISGSIPSGEKAEFTGFCHTKKVTQDGLVADIHMSDTNWEEAKVQVTGIRCRELPKDAVTSVPDTPLGTLLWKPDIDLLDNDGLWKYATANTSILPSNEAGMSLNQHLLLNGVKSTSVLDSICKIVDLAAHKNPQLSILQIGLDSPTLVSSLLSVLGSSPNDTPRFSSYALTSSNAEEVDQAAETFDPWKPKMSFSMLDPNIGLQEQGIRAGSIDILIAAIDCSTGEERQIFLQKVQTSLGESGRVLIYETGKGSSNPSREGSGSNNTLVPSSIPVGTYRGDEGILSIARKPAANEAQQPEMIYVLQHSNQEEKSRAVGSEVLNNFLKEGIQMQSMSWPPNIKDLEGKQIVSLLELSDPMLGDLSPQDFETLKMVATKCSHFLWVSMGGDPVMGAALGYLRVLRNENPTLGLRYLLVEDNDDRSATEVANVITKVAITQSTESEFVESSGFLSINRWVADGVMTKVTTKDEASGIRAMPLRESRASLKLVNGNSDHPKSIYFTLDDDASSTLGEGEVEVEVKAMLLNSNKLASLGGDGLDTSAKQYSGIVTKSGKSTSRLRPGQRVCLAQIGPYRTIIRAQERLCLQIPDKASFEEAASWPLTYAPAFQALMRMTHLRSGQSVLIQGGASAIGQAAVQLAKRLGAKVFATVSSADQRVLVHSLGVPNEDILSEDDQTLAAAVRVLSQGRGMDVILNTSITGESLRRLWHCIAPFGVFVDLGPSDAVNNSGLDMLPFQRGSTFSILNMDLIIRENPSAMADILEGLFELLARDSVYSLGLPSTMFPVSRVADAFAFGEKSGDVGKLGLTVNEQDQIPVSPSAQTQLHLRGDSTYILVGGLGGLGRSLARLLAEHGARHLVIISRSGRNLSSSGQKILQQLTSLGVAVRIFTCDVSDEVTMEKVIAQCSLELPPIRGVIQSAAVLRDAIYDNMTYEQWREATRPKIQGSWLLHKLLPQDMDFFVMLSSISGVVGNRSQANYAAGNTYQDSLAHYRRKMGLPGISVDLGLMLGIGLIAERGGVTNLQKSEAVGINELEFHSLMKAIISGSLGGSFIPAQVVCGLPTGGILQQGGLDAPFYFTDPRFLLLKNKDLEITNEENDGTNDEDSIVAQLAKSSSLHDASKVVSTALCGKVAKGLQTTVENIDASKPLHNFGIDSLMAVEIRSWVLVNIKSEISLFDVLSGVSIMALATKIAKLSKLVSASLE